MRQAIEQGAGGGGVGVGIPPQEAASGRDGVQAHQREVALGAGGAGGEQRGAVAAWQRAKARGGAVARRRAVVPYRLEGGRRIRCRDAVVGGEHVGDAGRAAVEQLAGALPALAVVVEEDDGDRVPDAVDGGEVAGAVAARVEVALEALLGRRRVDRSQVEQLEHLVHGEAEMRLAGERRCRQLDVHRHLAAGNAGRPHAAIRSDQLAAEWARGVAAAGDPQPRAGRQAHPGEMQPQAVGVRHAHHPAPGQLVERALDRQAAGVLGHRARRQQAGGQLDLAWRPKRPLETVVHGKAMGFVPGAHRRDAVGCLDRRVAQLGQRRQAVALGDARRRRGRGGGCRPGGADGGGVLRRRIDAEVLAALAALSQRRGRKQQDEHEWQSASVHGLSKQVSLFQPIIRRAQLTLRMEQSMRRFLHPPASLRSPSLPGRHPRQERHGESPQQAGGPAVAPPRRRAPR